MTFINLTPHPIVMNDGLRLEPSGTIARVSQNISEFDSDNIADCSFGEITGIPEPELDVVYVTSAIVAQAAHRRDVVSPATNHPLTKRDTQGHIISVPGFIRTI